VIVDSYRFAHKDWTTKHHLLWKRHLDKLSDANPAIKIVEVGSFEGRSSLFFADYLQHPDAKMFCIDTWKGGEEIERVSLPFNMTRVEANFDHNVLQHPNGSKIIKRISTSERGMVQLLNTYYNTIDFVYLDGSHTQRDTLVDLVLASCLVKPNGVIIIDDYLNHMATDNLKLRPRAAVDFVASSFDQEFTFAVEPEPSTQAVLIKR